MLSGGRRHQTKQAETGFSNRDMERPNRIARKGDQLEEGDLSRSNSTMAPKKRKARPPSIPRKRACRTRAQPERAVVGERNRRAAARNERKTGTDQGREAPNNEERKRDHLRSRSPDPLPENEDEDSADQTPLNIPDIIRKVEVLSEDPLKPLVYFTQQSAEIMGAEQGSILLHSFFDNGMPKELTDICVSYYEGNMKTMVSSTLADFQYFANGKVLRRVFAELPASERAAFGRRVGALSDRGPAYLWWFLMRYGLPTFIPLEETKCTRGGNYCSLWDGEGKEIAQMCFNLDEEGEQVPNNCPFVGLRTLEPSEQERVIRNDRRDGSPPTDNLEWHRLSDSVPYPELIGPCLNTSKVTLEQLQACSMALTDRTKKHDAITWLAFLFDLFRSYRAIDLWIANLRSFKETANPRLAQMQAILEWNRFYRKYHFGDAFCMIDKNEKGEEKEMFLSYEL